MQDCKDGSGLPFINFDLLTGSQEIKHCLSCKILTFNSSHCFVWLVHISLLLSLLAMVSSNFKIIK